MEWLPLLYQVLEVCIIPLFGLLTAYFVKYIKVKSAEIQTKVDSELGDKYIAMLTETITACVTATTQTYVEALKKEGKFDLDAQKIAFTRTYENVMAILADEAKEYLQTAIGDLSAYVENMIEAEVNRNK